MARYTVNEWQLAPIADERQAMASQAVDEAQWEALKEPIRILYMVENRNLKAVRAAMKQDHGLVGNKYQFEKHFNKWGFRKKLTEREWAAVRYQLQKRKREGKDSEVYLGALLLNPKKVRKAVSRYGSASVDTLEAASPKLPLDVQVCTPRAIWPDLDHVEVASLGLDSTSVVLRRGCSENTFTRWGRAEHLSTLPSPTSGSANMALLMHLPFMQFKMLLNASEAVPFSRMWCLEPSTPKDFQSLHNSLVKHLGNGIGGFHRAKRPNTARRAVIPDELWSDTIMDSERPTPGELLPIDKIRDLALFLLSNKMTPVDSEVGREFYSWIKNRNITEMFRSIGMLNSPTMGSLTEQLASIAIANSDIEMLRKILDAGLRLSDLKCHDWDFLPKTPLQYACTLSSPEMIRFLLDRGANVNETMEDTLSPLMIAIKWAGFRNVSHNRIRCVEVLLLAGADIKEPDNAPLIEAVRDYEPEIVKMLLAAGADPNIVGKNGSTPLITALENLVDEFCVSDYEHLVVKLLLEAHARVGYQGADYIDLPTSAVHNKELLQLLLENGALPTEESLMETLEYGDLETAELILQFNPQVTPRAVEVSVRNLLFDSCLEPRDETFKIILSLCKAIKSSKKGKLRELIIAAAICCGSTSHLLKLLSENFVFNDGNLLTKAIKQAVKANDASVFHVLFDSNSLHREKLIQSSGDALCSAIVLGYNEITEILLAAGVDTTAPDRDSGKSPLFYSIEAGEKELVYRLLSHKTVLSDRLSPKLTEKCKNFPFQCTASPLPAAVRRGDVTLTRELIKLNADVNGLEPELGEPALTSAVKRQDLEIAKLLIHAGADVNLLVTKFLGCTALAAAVRNSDLTIIQYLLGVGAEIDESALANAVGKQPIILESLIVAASKRCKRFPKGFAAPALVRAAFESNQSATQMLLTNGVDPDAMTRYSDIPPITKLGWSPFTADQSVNRTALTIALRNDRSEGFGIVKAFLDAGADPNRSRREDENLTPLQAAIMRNSPYLVKLLLAAGACANDVPDRRSKYTSLQYAAEQGIMNIVQLLLEYGADVNAPPADIIGATALQYALERGDIGIVTLLLEYGADVNDPPEGRTGATALQCASERGDIDIVTLLLEHGADVNAPPGDLAGATALQYASIKGHLGIVRVLLERWADVDAAPAKEDGRTAVEGAAEHGRIDVLVELVNAGAQLIGPGTAQYLRARERATENGHLALRNHLDILRNRQQADFDAGLTLPIWNESLRE